MATPLYLHVGLPKTGTTFLQGRLARGRDQLRQVGFVYPFVRPEAMFHAAVEVREQQTRWGLPAEQSGTLAALAARAAEVGGTAVISHEILGGASEEQIAGVLDTLAGFDVSVVVTARDLGRQVVAHWQEQVKNGQTYSYADFEPEILVPGLTGRVDEFWAEQDLLDVLDRWGSGVGPERMHVVVCPPPDADPELLWTRFADAIGLDPSLSLPEGHGRRNESLGVAEIALLRKLNEVLVPQLSWTDYAHTVKRFFSQQVLPGRSDRPATPARLRERLEHVTAAWVEEIRTRGYVVHGDLAELAPTSFAPDDSTPDDVPPAVVSAAAVNALAGLLLVEAGRRREKEPGTPAEADVSGGALRRAVRRLGGG
jgi:hypothetical protein